MFYPTSDFCYIHALSLLAIVTNSKGIFTNLRELQLRHGENKLGSMDMKSKCYNYSTRSLFSYDFIAFVIHNRKSKK